MASFTNPSSRRQPLLDEHTHLRDAVRTLELDLVRQRGTLADAAANLTNLRDLLVAHFAEEENRGLFQTILEKGPQTQGKVDTLKQEHQDFLRTLDELIQSATTAGAGETWWEAAQRKFGNFQEVFEAHEHQENRLLQDVFSDDLGTKD